MAAQQCESGGGGVAAAQHQPRRHDGGRARAPLAAVHQHRASGLQSAVDEVGRGLEVARHVREGQVDEVQPEVAQPRVLIVLCPGAHRGGAARQVGRRVEHVRHPRAHQVGLVQRCVAVAQVEPRGHQVHVGAVHEAREVAAD